MNRRQVAIILTVSLLIGGMFSAGYVLTAAQGRQATCDATLITLLLVAMRDYDYQPPIRLDFYNFAQYRALFEAATGLALPTPTPVDEESAGQQAAELVNRAATQAAEAGLPGLAEGIARLSDEAATIVDAGQEAVEAGATAVRAGVGAIESRSSGETLALGVVPGEPEICSLLRADLVAYLYAQLNAELNPAP